MTHAKVQTSIAVTYDLSKISWRFFRQKGVNIRIIHAFNDWFRKSDNSCCFLSRFYFQENDHRKSSRQCFSNPVMRNLHLRNNSRLVIFVRNRSHDEKNLATLSFESLFLYHVSNPSIFRIHFYFSSHISSVGGLMHRYRRVHGFKSHTGLNLF